MNSKIGITGWLLFGVACIVIFFMRSCKPPCKPEIVKMPVKDTMWQKGQKDSMFKHPVITYIPSDPKFIKGEDHIVDVPGKEKIVYVPKTLTNLDTAEAIQEYFIKRIYVDTLRGPDVLIALRDSIGMNKILGRTYQVKNSRLTFQNNTNPPKFKIFIGGSVGLALSLKSVIVAPQITFLTKTDAMYQLGYDIISGSPMLGMSWKIHLK